MSIGPPRPRRQSPIVNPPLDNLQSTIRESSISNLQSAMIRRVVVAAAALVMLTCAYTWPLIGQVGSAVPHDRGDPLLVTWILWWSTHTTPFTAAWWNAPAFHPSSGVFAFSENLLGLSPITAPVIALTKSALAGYNTAFLLSYLLSGLGAY